MELLRGIFDVQKSQWQQKHQLSLSATVTLPAQRNDIQHHQTPIGSFRGVFSFLSYQSLYIQEKIIRSLGSWETQVYSLSIMSIGLFVAEL